MAAIPLEPGESDWLIEQTAALIAAAGWQRLVSAPLVLPDEAGIGHAPPSLANAAPDRIPAGLSPAATSSPAAMSGPIPNAATRPGAPALRPGFGGPEGSLTSPV